jgi:guanylate kinase
MTKSIVTLTGLSCSGKTHLAAYLSEHAHDLTEAVSTTTRPMRAGELEGVNYYYVTHDAFKSIEDANGLVENVTYGKNKYGLSITEMNRIFDLGQTPVSVVEPFGAKEIKAKSSEFGINAINVYIDCPVSVALKRWYTRFSNDIKAGINNTQFYAERIALTLRKEVHWGSECDYHLILPYASNEVETQNQIKLIREAIVNKPEPLNTLKSVSAGDPHEIYESIFNLLNHRPSESDFIRLVTRIDNSIKHSQREDYSQLTTTI